MTLRICHNRHNVSNNAKHLHIRGFGGNIDLSALFTFSKVA